MKEYEVSIVTPLHEVDPGIFAKGAGSMKGQTFGFENIEWVVVIHNCSDEYKAMYHEILDGYDNIKTLELNNDKRTPSSPRNYGMSQASGRYIGFLDGDDSFTKDCIEKVISVIKKHDAQVVCFRREYELENPDDIPVTEIVLWDQLQEEIVVDREHWDDEKMFSGVCGMVTSRLYDKKFLDREGLKFDEDVLFGEDFLFNFEVYGHLERVVYLPQFIGYHYFINSGSLVQKSDKSPELLLAYAKGYTKVFDAGLKYGFYMNGIISRLCVFLSRYLTTCKAMTYEQRCEIRDILAPYIELTSPVAPNKVYSEKAAKDMYEIPRDVILHPEKWCNNNNGGLLVSLNEPTHNSANAMAAVLAMILEQNQNTDIGRHYSFRDIMTVRGYATKLPLTDYSFYQPLIRLTTRIGESGIFTGKEIQYYIITFQDDGEQWMIPCDRKMSEGYADMIRKLVNGHDSLLLYKSLPLSHKYNDNVYANTVSGTALSKLFDVRKDFRGTQDFALASPQELLFPKTSKDTLYLRLLFALADKDIDQIICPLCWNVLELFEYLENNWEELVHDIETGTISRRDDVSEELSHTVELQLKADAQRAAQLREIFKDGFGAPVAKRIWPKLSAVYTDWEGDQRIYAQALRRYVGGVVYTSPYFVSNGIIVGIDDGNGGYCLMEKTAFFEFIPEGENEAVLMDNIEEGGLYELVLTIASGLYRFRTRDVIRINSVNDSEIHFVFAYHRHDGLPIKLNEMVMAKAVNELAEIYRLMTPDYAYMTDGNDLTVLIEPEGVDEERVKTLNRDQMGDDLKNLLLQRDRNLDIGKVTVKFSEPETHKLHRDMLRRKNMIAPDEIRPIHFLRTEESRKFFMLNILESE
jgi:glycosyltransferase involved in cell wall biosynthesis